MTASTQHTPTPPTPALFDRVVRHVIDVEGGYVNDPADRGGETRYGISKRQYPDLHIATLTYEQAVEIYRQDYWHRYRCRDLPPAFGALLFDALVNHRPKTAVRFLQQALRVTADGYIGPVTLGAARTAAAMTSHSEIIALALAYRADFYHDLATADPTQERFTLGWFKRLMLLQQFVQEL